MTSLMFICIIGLFLINYYLIGKIMNKVDEVRLNQTIIQDELSESINLNKSVLTNMPVKEKETYSDWSESNKQTRYNRKPRDAAYRKKISEGVKRAKAKKKAIESLQPPMTEPMNYAAPLEARELEIIQ